MQYTGSNLNIVLDGITICYDDFGKGDVPMVFIHGFPFDKSMWKPQIDFLQSSNRVIAYDIRGYGKSTPGNQQLSINLFANDLIKFLDALRIEKVIACGLSMGGYILLGAINRFPERFHSIILADTQCIGDSPETKEKRKKSIQQIEAGGINDFAGAFVNNVFYKETISTNNSVVRKIEDIILSTSLTTISGTLNALAQRQDLCSSLENITIPTLILCGKEDNITPLAQSEVMHKNISGSVLRSIEMAGHMLNLEQPDEFNEHVFRFVTPV
jgi:3-oxoadipate enol-lactonase